MHELTKVGLINHKNLKNFNTLSFEASISPPQSVLDGDLSLEYSIYEPFEQGVDGCGID